MKAKQKAGGWTAAQVTFFTKQLNDRYRASWHLLAMPLRIAVVEQFVLQVVFNQASETVEIQKVRDLCIALNTRMGTLE